MKTAEAAKICCNQIRTPGGIASVIRKGITDLEAENETLKKAMRQLRADHPNTPVSWPDRQFGTRYQTIEDWVAYHLESLEE